jgi:hypothetical protein
MLRGWRRSAAKRPGKNLVLAGRDVAAPGRTSSRWMSGNLGQPGYERSRRDGAVGLRCEHGIGPPGAAEIYHALADGMEGWSVTPCQDMTLGAGTER